MNPSLSETLRLVSIVLPSYQCRPQLEHHVEFMAPVLAACARTIWVSSPSEDGTHEFSEKCARWFGGLSLVLPRGLYQAWNQGIARVETPWTYISTVGELVLPEFLGRMIRRGESTRADLVVSAPFPTPGNLPFTRRWPVRKHGWFLWCWPGRLLPRPFLLYSSLAGGHATMMGSSASNLYRTVFLQEKPFPENFGDFGDSALLYRTIGHIRITFCRGWGSGFVPHEAERVVPRMSSFRRLVRETRSSLTPFAWKAIARFLAIRTLLAQKRGARPSRGWWLNPALFWFRVLSTWYGLLGPFLLRGQSAVALKISETPGR